MAQELASTRYFWKKEMMLGLKARGLTGSLLKRPLDPQTSSLCSRINAYYRFHYLLNSSSLPLVCDFAGATLETEYTSLPHWCYVWPTQQVLSLGLERHCGLPHVPVAALTWPWEDCAPGNCWSKKNERHTWQIWSKPTAQIHAEPSPADLQSHDLEASACRCDMPSIFCGYVLHSIVDWDAVGLYKWSTALTKVKDLALEQVTGGHMDKYTNIFTYGNIHILRG